MSEAIATVVAITGKAYARNAEGLSRPLEAGDVLREGETVVTSPGGRVELALGNGEVLQILPEQSVLISAEMSADKAAGADEAAVTAEAVDRVVQALESGRDPFDELEAPAAGLAGGGAGEGNDFVRLLRITEEVDPLALQFDQAATVEDPTIVGVTGNQAPLVVDDSASTEPGRTVDIDVLANDSDPDGDRLAIVAVAGQPIAVDEPITLPEGVVSLNPDGTLSFAPSTGFEGELSFEYTVSDGNSLASGQVSITVGATADSQPLAVDDSATTTVGTSVSGNLAANDSPSLDGGNVWALVDAPDHGSVIVNADGSYTYTPGSGFTGEDRFSYSITDADGDVSTAEVTVTVVDGSSPPPADDAPVAVDDSVSIEVDEIAAGSLADNDTPSNDGGNVWALQTPPENGTAVVDADGSFRYTPDAGFSGRDSFTYTVTDVDGDVSMATVFISVGVADSVPIAQDDEFTVQTGTTFEGDLAENDTPSADGGNVWAISQLAGGGEVVVNADGTFSYTPDEGYFGIDSFTYTVTDIDGDVSTGTVIIDVVDTDGVPTAVDDSFSTDQDVAFDGDLAANDEPSPDGDNVWSLISGPANGTVVINEDGTFTYTPDEGFNGTDSFFYRVTDADGDDSTATATITVNSTNADPEAVDDGPLSTDEDTPLTGIDVLGNDTDADGDPLTVTSATSPDGTVTINPDGTLDFTPDPDFNGPTTIEYTIDDGNGGSDTATVTINVAPVNDDPVAEDDTGATQEDAPVTFTAAELLANDSDVDGDALTIASVGASTNGTAVLNADGSVTFTPELDFTGTASFEYTVEDGNGGIDTATVTIDIPTANDAPIAVDDGPLSTDEDTPLTGIDVLGNDTDADGDPLTVTSATSPDGTVTINPDGSLDFTPNADFNGPTTIEYTVDDGNGGTDTATVTINVAPVNDAPVAEDDTGSTQEDAPVTFTAAELLANDSDIDGDVLTITSVGPSTNGTAVLNADGSVTFTPTTDFNGTASFVYTVEDGNGGSDTATVTITIPPANDAPIAVDDGPLSTNEDTPLTGINVLGNDTDADGDPLTVTSATSPDGTVTINADGSLDFTPNADFNGPTTIEYTIDDGNGGTDTATVTINVAPVNDAPVAEDDTGATQEDAPVTFTAAELLANDSDIDGDVLTITSVGPSTNGTAVLNADGSVTFTPTTDFNGTASFVHTVEDGNGGSDTATVTITIPPVSDAPIAVDDGPLSTNEDTPLTGINVLGNDTDSDGDPLTVTSATSPDGTVTINPDGSLDFTPNADFNGPTTIEYTIDDGNGGTDTATVTINVAPVNDAPVAEDDTGATQEDAPVTFTAAELLANDSDVDGDLLTITAVGPSTNGTAVLNADGSVTFTPTTDFNGTASFVYTVEDGNGASDTATVTITIPPVNDAPIAVDDGPLSTNEDTPLTGINVLGNDTDADGDPLTVTSATSPDGTVAINPDGTLDFTPNADFNGPTTIEYTVDDGNGGTDTATVTINVAPVNDAPVAEDDSGATQEDVPLTFSAAELLANDSDIDGDVLTITAVGPSTNGTAVLNADGSVTFTPTTDFNGTASFVYTVEDGNGGSDTATVTITIPPVNDAPIAVDDGPLSTDEDTPLTGINVLGNDTDADGDPLTVTSASSPDGTVAINADGSLDFTPNADFNGPTTIEYTVDDGNGGTDTATVTINVAPVNDAPIAVDDGPLSTNEDTPLTGINVLGNDTDADGDPLTVTSASSPDGTVTINPDGSLDFTPDPDFNGPTTIEYTIDDGNGGTDTATVTINVAPVNDAPVAEDDTGATQEDVPVTFTAAELLANDSDVDGDALTITAVGPSTNGTAVLNADGSVTFTPTTDFNGTASFVHTVEDGNGGSDTATVTITIPPVNDAPIAVDDGPLSTNEDTPLTGINVLGNDTDSDGDPLTVTSASSPDGTVTINADGSLDFTPNADFNGPTTIEYTIDDGNGGTDTATVTINVTPVNDAPVAEDDSGSTQEDVPLTFTAAELLANDSDIDGDVLTITAVGPSTNGTAVLNADGSVTFTPTTDFNGTASFVYTVEDGNGASDTATVTITIPPVNDAPIAVDDGPLSTNEDTPLTGINVLGNDTDADGDPLTVTSATSLDGTVAINPDGTLDFTPNADFNGPTTIEYTVDDGNGGTDTATVTINVAPVNDAPVAEDDGPLTTDEDAPLIGIDVLGNDTDADGDVLTVTSATSPDGTVTINADGTLDFMPNPDFIGSTTIQYTIVDGNGGSDTATVTIDVPPVNDAPVAIADSAITTEDTGVAGDLTPAAAGQDFDIDGDIISVVGVVSGAAAAPPAGNIGVPVTGAYGTLTVGGDGSYSYSPGPAANALLAGETVTEVFTYAIDDGNGGTDSATLSITIHGADDAPVIAGPLDGVVQEDGTKVATGTLSISDADAGQSGFVAQSGVPGSYGSFSITDAGVWTYTLDNSAANVQSLAEGESHVETFEISTVDGTTRTIEVRVDGSNDAPIAVDDTGSLSEGITVAPTVVSGDLTPALAGQDRDIDNGASFAVTGVAVGTQAIAAGNVGVSLVGSYGSIVVDADGGYTYTLDNTSPATNGLAEGQIASEVFTYTIVDEFGAAGTATLTLEIIGTNDAAVISGDTSGSVTEDLSLLASGVLAIDDPDGADSFVAETTAGNYGSLSIAADGNWTYTLDNPSLDVQSLQAGETHQEIFEVIAADGTATQITIDVIGTNDAPVAIDDGFDISAFNALTISLVSDALLTVRGTIDGNGNFKDLNGGVYQYSVEYGTNNTWQGSSSTIAQDSGLPPQNLDEYFGSFFTNGGDPLTMAEVESHAAIYAGPLDDAAAFNAFVQGNLDAGVIWVNGDLTLLGGNADFGLPNTPVMIVVDGNIVLGGNKDFLGGLFVSGNMTVANGGNVTVTGSMAVFGDALLQGAVTVEGDEQIRDALAEGAYLSPIDIPVTDLLANDSDIDMLDVLSVTAVGNAVGGTVTLLPGTDGIAGTADDIVRFEPSAWSDSLSFEYTIDDGHGGSDTAHVTLTNTGNRPPQAIDDVASTAEDTPVSIDVLANDSDPEGDAFSVIAVSSANGGTVVVNPDGSLAYTPPADFSGIDTLTYTIRDASGLSSTATVAVTVTPVNDAPVAGDDTGVTQEDVPVTFTAAELLANDSDVDGDALTITSVGPSTNGTAVLNADGSVTFTPTADFNGTASFVYTVDDGNGGSDSATVTMTIPAGNDAPVAIDDGPLSTPEDTSLTAINVLGNDSDVDGDVLAVTSATSPDGTVTINADGTLDFTPNPDFNGPTTIQYTISDGNGGSDTATVSIEVTAVNDPPLAGGSAVGVEDVPLVLSWADFGVSDVDSPAGAMSIEIVSLPADGMLEVLVGAGWTPVAIGQSISNAIIESGALRFVPAAEESGSDAFGGTGIGDQQADYAAFAFIAHDGQGATTAGTLTIDIQPVADQPSLALGPTIVDPTTEHFFLPAGTGLALDRFDNVATLDPASAADADLLESTLAALTPDASSVVTDLGSGNTAGTAVDVPLDAAFRLTGLIYLESGHSYTLSGYRDDTFHVEIGGQVLLSEGHNTWGSYTAAAFTPSEAGYYTIEAYVYNGDGVGDVSVLVSTDGGTPQPLSAHATFTDVAAVAAAGGQLSDFVGGADGGYYPVRRNEGLEDTPIQLQGINAALTDNDGSETLTLSIGSLPEGSVLTDGSNSFVASSGATTADVTGWDVEGLQITAPSGFTGSFTLDVSATSTESSTGQGATTTLPLVVTVLDVERAPSISGATARVSEEGLDDGIADATGVPVDASDSAVASGAMPLSNPDDDPIDVSLSAPADSLTSAGQPVSWTGVGTSTLIGSANGSEVIRVSVAADGSYTVTLAAALDHSGAGVEDVLEFDVGVTISDGTGSSTAPLRIVVEDDAPGVATTTAAVHVAVDEIIVSGLEAGWTNAVFVNGTNQVTRINNDADAYNDAVMWGRPASGSGQSGYVLDDDDVLASAGGRQVQAGESFVIAEFSHLNWPVYSNSSLLDSVTLNIDMQVAINGVAYPVSFEVLVDHEETPNNGADPRDIITLPAQSVTVNVGGQDYEIRLDGFVDGNGNVVNVIRTDEQASNEFSIVGSIVSNDPLPAVSGNVFAEAGADGSAAGVVWGNTASSNGVLQTGSDGSYQFIVDRDVRESLEPGQTLTETFGYTITDRDGDSQNGSLVVRISGHQRIDGTAGGDNLVGGAEDELLSGFAGSDQIDGGGGNDVLIGGAGDDDMSGGIGADVFVWELADRGAPGDPAQDTISDFDTAASSDALDLRDLLQGESHGIDGGNLGDYLHFESSGADTIVHVSSNGGFSSGYSAAQEDVSITLQGVDLFSGGLSSDQQVIQDLLSKGKLITD